MTTDAANGQTLTVRETLLICAFLSSGISSLCIWVFYWIEGVHYVSLLHSPQDVAWLWARYFLAVSLSGLLGYGLVCFRSRPRDAGLVTSAVLIGASVPVLLGLFATRFVALEVWGFRAEVVALIVAGMLILLMGSFSSRIFWGGGLPLLIAAPAVITAINLLAWLRPSDFKDARGLTLAAVICIAAAAGSMPLLWGLGAIERNRRAQRLGALVLVAMLVLVATVVIPGLRRSATALPIDGAAKNRPSVLLIVIDTLRADALTPFGADARSTPAIQGLARDSVVFTRVMSAAPWTTPAFASILSSTYPSQHRAGSRDAELGYKQSLTERIPTIPAVLRDYGYWTGSVLTNAYLGRRFGLNRGFHVYENLLAVEWGHPVLVGLARIGLFEIPAFVRAPRQTERVLNLIRRGRSSGRPFFVLAHYMDPHLPYRGDPGGPAKEDLDAEAYRSEVRYLDQSLGRLVSELKREGLYDDMLIVLTADHGEELEENRGFGSFGHGHTLYEEVLHIPLLVKLPRNENGGQRRDEPVSSIDVGPTILDHIGIEIPTTFRGTPLLSERATERPIFSERTLYGPERKAIILGNRKVVLDLDDENEPKLRGYDLSVDPQERRPIDVEDAAFHPLVEALEAFAEGDVEVEDGERAEIDPRLRQRLEALGYGE